MSRILDLPTVVALLFNVGRPLLPDPQPVGLVQICESDARQWASLPRSPYSATPYRLPSISRATDSFHSKVKGRIRGALQISYRLQNARCPGIARASCNYFASRYAHRKRSQKAMISPECRAKSARRQVGPPLAKEGSGPYGNKHIDRVIPGRKRFNEPSQERQFYVTKH